MLGPVYHAHRASRGTDANGAGGFIDVGANVGDVSELVIRSWTRHAARFYVHHLTAPGVPPLVDAVHSIAHADELAFAYLLEAAPATHELLRRRFDAELWANSHVELLAVAAGNRTGTQRFCTFTAGSGQSSLADAAAEGVMEASGAAADGTRRCTHIETTTVTDLVNSRAGINARVFFLKVDVEGAEALILAGARELFAARRVSYVLFENHIKWRALQTELGVSPLVLVGDAVRAIEVHGYRCFYMHLKGLIPFPALGTPAGDRVRPVTECHEGGAFCARGRVYERQFWSNILCGLNDEAELGWLQDSLVPPRTTREELLATLKN
jgi:FkbM family methyltransferase